ncbi:MAG: hypothetical protein EBZ91_08910 [Gammaproteobacteria bacterium]|nr:hypothetical protein [Gammaproteobacteria bacterium]
MAFGPSPKQKLLDLAQVLHPNSQIEIISYRAKNPHGLQDRADQPVAHVDRLNSSQRNSQKLQQVLARARYTYRVDPNKETSS